MIRKKSIMAAALAAVLACQTFPAFGGAAPDGKTQKSREEIAAEIRARLIPLEKTDRETENL